MEANSALTQEEEKELRSLMITIGCLGVKHPGVLKRKEQLLKKASRLERVKLYKEVFLSRI
ncbi:MAG: hypothetical protein JXD19_03625 [Deltaproteobacteria bacterium]|nr:hypothetical protein [Deltaproteobacteria bacterium]